MACTGTLRGASGAVRACQQRHSAAASLRSVSSISSGSACRAAASASQARGRRPLRVLAFRWDPHNIKASEKITDWRVQQMVELAYKYLMEFLTNKRSELADELFAEDVVHKDVVWDPTHPTVGIEGMCHYQADLAAAFPDFWVEIDQYATVDNNAIVVTYRGSATNLGEYHHHKPTHHASAFEGANTFRFNHDRSRITSIDVYRSAFAEDLDEVGERKLAEEGGFRSLRLQRLV